MSLQLTFDLIHYCMEKYPGKYLFRNKQGENWTGISSEAFAEEISKLSRVLLAEGVAKGECVASVFSWNCYEWNIIDMALARIGAVHLPVYPTISDSDYHFILEQAEVKRIFLTDQVLYNKVAQLQSELPLLRSIVSIERLPSVDHFWELLHMDLVNEDELEAQVTQRIGEIRPDTVCTILYTSGTTGFPKGVMLTHRNLCTNIEAAASHQPLSVGDHVLCFLPLCHIYQRTAVYQFIMKGVEVYYAESLKALLQNMKEIGPTGTTVVPRVLEKIVTGIRTRAQGSGAIKRGLILWSIRFGYRFEPMEKRTLFMRIRHSLADKLVYRYVRSLLGGRLSYVGCGGAPVDARILRFFWAAGIPVYEGYGLTESAPLVALNYPGTGNCRIGTVGPLINDVEVEIMADREIRVRGPNVMKGYFRNEEQTQVSLQDGWLYTGDLGEIIDGRFLRIIGRKKEMFKTSYGKYIVPQAIENRFVDSRIIDYLIVIGEGKHYAAAIVSPDFRYARSLLPPGFKGSNKDIAGQKEIIAAINREINQVNRQLGKTEQIKKHLVVEDQWTVESGELSPTQKLKRNIIMHKYAARIRELYREDNLKES